jgi:outer membrane lipoprotein SlyB
LRGFALPFLLPGLLPLILAGCKPAYSPNTYAANAAQEEAAVQRGVIIGVRQVMISADGTIGAVAGGAAGGVAGAQVAGGGVVTALGAIGGTLVGGIGGTAAAQAVADTKGWEYIVQEEPGDKLVSVTQTSKTALPVGLNVLVIAGVQQARIVPDYTVQVAAAPGAKAKADKSDAAPDGSTAFEVNIGPVPAEPGGALPLLADPLTVASDSKTPPGAASAGPASTPASSANDGVNNAGSAPGAVAGLPTASVAPAAPGPGAPAGSAAAGAP